MGENWDITEEGSVVIRQTAVFDLKDLYKILYEWAKENLYLFNEKNFTEKVKGDGREYVIEWVFERKVTDFIKFNINIEIWGLRVNDVNIKGRKMQRGELELVFDAVMEMDYNNRWEGNPFIKFLRHVYIYYLKKQYFLDYAGKLWTEVYGLHARIKTKLSQFSLF